MLMENVTLMLRQWEAGDDDARDALFQLLHVNLLKTAHRQLASHGSPTLQPADLVNESLLRMLAGEAGYRDRTHLLATAALKVRSVLVDHLRAKASAKRGGDLQRVTLSLALDGDDAAADGEPAEVFALHQALDTLAEFDARAADVIELTYFGGMNRSEIAMVLGVSLATVDRDLLFGRTWLSRQLGR